MTVSSSAKSMTSLSLYLSKSTALLSPGGYEQLSATISPSDATSQGLVWTSANTNYVTVDQTGLIRGVAVTSSAVNVTATSVDGLYSATCAVTVSNTPNDWSDLKGSSDARILLAVAGDGQSNQGVWVSRDYGYTWKQVSNILAWATTISPSGQYAVGRRTQSPHHLERLRRDLDRQDEGLRRGFLLHEPRGLRASPTTDRRYGWLSTPTAAPATSTAPSTAARASARWAARGPTPSTPSTAPPTGPRWP